MSTSYERHGTDSPATSPEGSESAASSRLSAEHAAAEQTPAQRDRASAAALDRDFTGVQASEEFGALRRALRRFVFPATAAFLAWYLLYVLLSAYARDFMGTKVVGNFNVAFVFGILQFLSTFGLAIAYSRYASRKIDPLADRIRANIEGAER